MANRIPPITPTPGVPDELIQKINSRFRALESTGQSTGEVVQRVVSGGGGGGGDGGVGTPPPSLPAPPIIAFARVVTNYTRYGNDYQVGFGSIFQAPANPTGVHYDVRVTLYEAGPRQFLDIVLWDLFGGFTPGNYYETISGQFIDGLTAPPSGWAMEFLPVNSEGVSSSPTYAAITIDVPTVTLVTASEVGPRLQQVLQNNEAGGALMTSVKATPILTLNRGGAGGKETVTIWETHDWGDGRGQVTTWKGWYEVTGTSSDILLTGDNQLFVTTLASAVVTIQVAVGAVDKNDPIPGTAKSGTFTMNGPSLGATPAGVFQNAFVKSLAYSQTPASYTWRWTGFQVSGPIDPTVTTGPLKFNADLWFGRFFLAKGAWNAGTQTWTPDPSYPEWAVGDTEDGTETTAGTTITTIAAPPQPFQAAGDPFPTFRVRLLAYTRLNDDTGVQQNCWTGTEPAGAVNATNGSAVYITPDPTKATTAPAPAAPNILSDATTVASVYWEPFGHDWKRGFQGTLHLPTTDANYAHLKQIDVVLVDLTGKTIPGPTLYAPFTGSTVNFQTDTFPVVFPLAETWTLSFVCLNDDGVATPAPITRSVVVGSPTITGVNPSESGPRLQIALQNNQPGGPVTTSVNVDTTLSFNPGGSTGRQCVTIWDTHDWGDGRGPVTTWKGWYDVIGAHSVIPLTGDNQLFVTTIAGGTPVTITVAIGAVDKNDPIPVAVSTGTFTMNGPSLGGTPAGIFQTAFVKALAYSQTPAGYTWRWTGFQVSAPVDPTVTTGSLKFNADLWFGRFFLAKGAWNAGTQAWTPDPNYPEWAVGDTEDGTETISGTTITTIASPPQPFQASGDPYPTFRVRLLAFTHANGDAGLQQNCWTGTEPTGAVNATNGSAVYITPDPTKATGPAPGPNPPAVNLTGATMTYTLGQQNGAPIFTASGQISLPADTSHLTQINVYAPGLFGILAWVIQRPSTGWPASPMNYSLGNFSQSVVQTTYTWHFEAVNQDNIETGGGPSGSLAVPAASGNLTPPPGVITVSSVVVGENTNLRTRQPDLLTQATLTVTVNTPSTANYGNQNYTAWYSDDGGNNFLWSGWYSLASPSGSFSLYKVVPTANKSVVVAIVPGAIGGDPATPIPAATLVATYTNRVLSNTFNFTGLSGPTTGAIASAVIGGIIAVTDPNGAQDWAISDITITDKTPVSDPNAAFSRLIVYIGNASNTQRATAADGGNDALVASFPVDGTVHHCNMVAYWGYPVDPTMTTAWFRIEVVNAAGVATIQSCWSGAQYGPAVFGPAPAGTINGKRMDPLSLGPGILPRPSDKKIMVANPNVSTSLINDWDFHLSVNTPSLAWGATGASVFQTGGINGGPYCELNGSGAMVQQTFAVAPGEPLYVQVATRYVSGQMAVRIAFYDTNNNSLGSSVTIGTVISGGTWVASGVSGAIPGSSVPANASYGRITMIMTTSGICDFSAVIVQQVTQQTTNGQTLSEVPMASGGDQSALRTYTGIDQSASVYGKNMFQLTYTDGVTFIQGILDSLGVRLTLTQGSGGSQNSLQLSTGTMNMTIAGITYTGYTGSVSAAVSAGKLVKNGWIVN